MQFPPGSKAVFAVATLAASLTGADNNSVGANFPPRETLHYGVEWRLITAGIAKLSLRENPPASNRGWNANVSLESTGIVSKLFKVSDQYRSNYESGFCATDSFLQSNEGKRRRETTVRFDRTQNKATYLERDLVKNSVVKQTETPIPECVQDVVGALYRLRTMRLQPGQSATIRLSDGKKSADVRVEAQEWEEIKTKAGNFKTLRYEAFLFNGVIYERQAKVHIWISEDEKHLPVQIKLRLNVAIGTVTLQLEKEDRT